MFHKVEYTSNEHGTDYRYEPEYREDLIPCFNCNSTEDVDQETGLCRGSCKPNLSNKLPQCQGNYCQVYLQPGEEEPF